MRLVGTDMSERAVGRDLADAFHVVPAGSDAGFADVMLDVAAREGVRTWSSQSSFDLMGLAEAKARFEEAGVVAMVASPIAIRRANDKAESYALLDAIGVRGPAWRRERGAAVLRPRASSLSRAGRRAEAGLLVRVVAFA